MAKVSSETHVTITLTLSEYEATIIGAAMLKIVASNQALEDAVSGIASALSDVAPQMHMMEDEMNGWIEL